MDDVRGRFLGLPHDTTPAAVTKNKNIKMSSFKSSENIQKKEGELISQNISADLKGPKVKYKLHYGKPCLHASYHSCVYTYYTQIEPSVQSYTATINSATLLNVTSRY